MAKKKKGSCPYDKTLPHITTRTDGSHAILNSIKSLFLGLILFPNSGKISVYYRIKPHTPPREQISVRSFEFQPCDHTPQAECLTR